MAGNLVLAKWSVAVAAGMRARTHCREPRHDLQGLGREAATTDDRLAAHSSLRRTIRDQPPTFAAAASAMNLPADLHGPADGRAASRWAVNAVQRGAAWLATRVLRSPWLLTTTLMFVAFLLIRPWGNYPLNDDWTYSHLAKRIAETGVVKIDVPLAPNAVGQALIGALAVKLFGFSHTVLRITTFLLGCVGLWAIDALLRHARTPKAWRYAGLILLAFNPIYFYSATTFMNEMYGWVPALLVAVLWFWDRRRLEEGAAADTQLISFWVVALAGILAGATFWTRQFCVLVYPALLVGTVLRFIVLRRWLAIVRALPGIVVGTAVFAATIYGFFVWARATGNFRPEFAARIDNLLKVDATTYGMQVGSALVYMTAFYLPLLATLRWAGSRRWLIDGVALAFVVLGLVAKNLFETHATSDFWIGPIWGHRVFPFVVNIIYNAGLGPVTLDDTFFYNAAKPEWPRYVWTGLETIFIAAGALWSPFLAAFVRATKSLLSSRSAEVLLFALALLLGSLLAILQAHQGEMVDRYYLPLILSLAVLVPGVLGTAQPLLVKSYGAVRFGLLLAPLVLFTVLAAHDQFRWNDARWSLIDLALKSGGTRATVQGGWEPNCWFRHEGLSAEELACQGGCSCVVNSFCCVDDRFRVGMSVSAGYHRLAGIQPSYWLATGPEVVLSRRDVR